MKKSNKKIKLKLMFFGFVNVAIFSTLFLSSCSAVVTNPIKFKIMDAASSSANEVLLESLKTNNASPKNAILGDKSINQGNYIIIYGSIAGSTTTSDFRDWLSGGSVDNGGGITTNPKINNNFLNAFLNVQELNSQVEVMLFIDNPEFSPQDNIFSKLNYDPYETYTQDILLEEYNYNWKIDNGLPQTAGDQIVEFDLLPDSYKNLENKFIRSDDSATSYREFVDYAVSIRPNLNAIVGDNNKLSGAMAFKSDKAPSTLEGLSVNTGSSIETNDVVKNLYRYYLDKEYNQ